MRKIVAIFTLVLLGSLIVSGAPRSKGAVKKKRPLPYKALSTNSKESPHILFVNVNKAISTKQLDKATGLINALYGFNLGTASVKKSMVADVVADSGFIARKFGENAVLAVFIEKNQKGYNYLQAPGWWSMVNVNNLDKDQPKPDVLQERIAKVLLRGLAMCCGAGANHDPRCVMYVNGFDLKGIDAVSYTYSPFAYQPIMQALKKLGTKAPYKSGY